MKSPLEFTNLFLLLATHGNDSIASPVSSTVTTESTSSLTSSSSATTTTTTAAAGVSLTKCQRERLDDLKQIDSGIMDLAPAECQANGDYKPVQCQMPGCYCVNTTSGESISEVYEWGSGKPTLDFCTNLNVKV